MKSKVLRLMGITLGMVVFACSQSEAPKSDAPEIPMMSPMKSLPADTPAISGSAPVNIPEGVKGKWTAVKLLIEDKQEGTSKEYTVALGETLSIADSKLVVDVQEFLPDLKIEGNTFTSASNDLLNPSVRIAVKEDGKEVFQGWLFQLFPSVHPFQHERYNIVLRGPISAS